MGKVKSWKWLRGVSGDRRVSVGRPVKQNRERGRFRRLKRSCERGWHLPSLLSVPDTG